MTTNTTTNTVLIGDVRAELKQLPRRSVDCVVTSPPYFRLRNYDHDEQIGLENHVDQWVDNLRQVFTELARVLTPTGSVWLNLGDSYSRDPASGAQRKSLVLAPERLILALAADGWIIRNKVIWAKTNPMPNSVSDRLACTHEYIYFLTREPNYFFDLDAIRVPHRSQQKADGTKRKTVDANAPIDNTPPGWAGPLAGNNSGLSALKRSGRVGHHLGKNPGDVWTMATANFRGAHFATFPRSLVERPILATCPERVCLDCGLGWLRKPNPVRSLGSLAVRGELRPQCNCKRAWRPGLVLDPFFGAGTVGVVAESANRDWLGIEINPDFASLATKRITDQRNATDGRRAA